MSFFYWFAPIEYGKDGISEHGGGRDALAEADIVIACSHDKIEEGVG